VKIPSFGVSQHFADKIHWVLDPTIGTWLPSLNDNRSTDHITHSRYVKLQVFMGFQGYQTRWGDEIFLQAFEGFLCLLGPLDLVMFLEELKKWESADAES
jgi:hypothetical protein